jgi:predicted SAM-dependent methyltransferase
MPISVHSFAIPSHSSNGALKIMKKIYIRVPDHQRRGRFQALRSALVGSILSPAYYLLASIYGAPGLRFRACCAFLGLRLLYNRKGPVSYADVYRLLFAPMDSVRYFEFDFIWRALSETPIRRFLDVSSPRLFPVMLLNERREIAGDLVNPDERDLQTTAGLVKACGLDSRCRLLDCRIEHAPFASESFDAITTISVVEHIPQDREAIKKIWALLRPGGKLLITVPCGAVAEEEYTNVDFFGLQTPDESGFFFHQYRYDRSLLEDRFYSVTGSPAQLAIYGEKKAGTLLSGLLKKWSGQKYPLWKEPYVMAREFQRYETLSDLPGEGVIAMEFIKK